DSVRGNPDTVKAETSEMAFFVSASQPLEHFFSLTPLDRTIFFSSRLTAIPVSRLTSTVSNLDSFQPLEQPVTLITDQSLPVA
ncbi:hypothetical protein NL347_28495, partial [Klebsiella pneumoniae]|nr:hypothetical protein [Klebsiella pneumoniae]